ncbi:hypothetical protein EIP91_005155 [Steccherinum ochraceum]|uniref:Uncharacterized protein n=1 Tax=Steccherinum ochraceum TaxID=92696 RepID=A0A4R0RIL9_9APHY|nr:hypothetical protein EIP91_005155 [Steccherinum ochraceum]
MGVLPSCLCQLFRRKRQSVPRVAPAIAPPQDRLVANIRAVNGETAALSETMRLTNVQIELAIAGAKQHDPSSAQSRKFVKEMENISNEWKEVIAAYQRLVWDTRELAGEAQAIISDFVHVFLPRLRDPDIGLCIKLTELKQYASDFEAERIKPKRIEASLNILLGRISSIEATWSQVDKPKSVAKRYKHLPSMFSEVRSVVGNPNVKGLNSMGVCSTLQWFCHTIIAPPTFMADDMADTAVCSSRVLSSGTSSSIAQCPANVSAKLLAISCLAVAVRVDLTRLANHMDARFAHLNKEPSALEVKNPESNIA